MQFSKGNYKFAAVGQWANVETFSGLFLLRFLTSSWHKTSPTACILWNELTKFANLQNTHVDLQCSGAQTLFIRRFCGLCDDQVTAKNRWSSVSNGFGTACLSVCGAPSVTWITLVLFRCRWLFNDLVLGQDFKSTFIDFMSNYSGGEHPTRPCNSRSDPCNFQDFFWWSLAMSGVESFSRHSSTTSRWVPKNVSRLFIFYFFIFLLQVYRNDRFAIFGFLVFFIYFVFFNFGKFDVCVGTHLLDNFALRLHKSVF